MSRITPFLWFDTGKLQEALQFYLSVFEDARILSQNPMSAEFELLGQRFMALAAGPQFRFNEAVSFFIRCKDQAEVDYYWNALCADGGAESQCGWLKDKYGLSWQVIPDALGKHLGDPDLARAQRAMQAMQKMTKIVVAELVRASAGRA
jgi:predicted 3-demethylubiquinone-9 3-methyltransferase (glyoxalase superfamily)